MVYSNRLGLRPALTEAILLPAPSLRGFRVHLLDDHREWLPDFFVVPQAAQQPLLGLLVGPLSLLTLHLGYGGPNVNVVALMGPPLVMPVQRVRPCKQVAAVQAKGDRSRVRLRGLAVALEDLEVPEPRVWAEPALDDADGPACPVVRSRFQEGPLPRVEALRDVENSTSLRLLQLAGFHVGNRLVLLRHRAADVVLYRSLHTPLNPRLLSLHNRPRRRLLDTWSLQGSIGNSLCVRSREPPRSASRGLGFPIYVCRGPSGRLVCLQDPSCNSYLCLAPLTRARPMSWFRSSGASSTPRQRLPRTLCGGVIFLGIGAAAAPGSDTRTPAGPHPTGMLQTTSVSEHYNY